MEHPTAKSLSIRKPSKKDDQAGALCTPNDDFIGDFLQALEALEAKGAELERTESQSSRRAAGGFGLLSTIATPPVLAESFLGFVFDVAQKHSAKSMSVLGGC